MPPTPGEVTRILGRLSAGDRSAESDLFPLIFGELHRLAAARLRGERNNHTLQATALVNEAYVRLCGSGAIGYTDRAHFLRLAARLMRRILVDYARQRNAQKRPPAAAQVPLEGAVAISDGGAESALAIDELLERLAKVSDRAAQVVEMRFFGGLSEDEIAAGLDVTVRTVRRDWAMARAWLHGALRSE
ncbi:MAG: ECF-type sigma factor [Bryobacteraceae bacterium]|nr:ECF-type sigma factor [Bryobacteraceae bacterium]